MQEPDPPDAMLGLTREHWAAFWRSDVASLVSESDLPALLRWVEAIDELHRVRDELTETRLVCGSTGQPVLNPLAAYAQQLTQEVARLEDAFGMTPTARLRLLAAAGEKERTLDEELARLVGDVSAPVVNTED